MNLIKTYFFIAFSFAVSFSNSQTDVYKKWEEQFKLGQVSFNSKQYTQAELHFEAALKASKEVLNENSEQVLSITYFYANCKYLNSKFNEALQLFKNVLVKVKKLPNRDLNTEVKVWTEIIAVLSRLGKNEEAISEHIKLNEFVKTSFRENSEIYATMLNNFGQLYFSINDCATALTYYKKAEKIFIELNSQIETVSVLYNNIGLCNFQYGNYIEADNAYSNAFDILEKLGFENQIFHSKLLSNISVLEMVFGRYDNAKTIQQMALEKLFDLNLYNTIDYADGLLVYGQILKELGKFDNAIYEVKRAEKLYREILPKDHMKFGNVNNILGELHLNNGDTKLAFTLFNKSIELYENKKVLNHIFYGYALNGMGTTYRVLGDNNKALEFYLKGQNVLKEALTENHKDYGITLMNIGDLYTGLGNYILAAEYLIKAVDIIADTIGANNSTYGQLCIMILRLAHVNPDEKISDLENLTDLAISIFSSQENKNNLFYNYAYFYKAVAKMENKQHQQALEILLNIEKELAKDVDDTSQLHRNIVLFIAINYDILGDYNAALNYYIKENQNQLRAISELFTFRSEEEKKAFLNNVSNWFSMMNKVSVDENFKNKEILTLALNNQLLFKGLLLNSSKNILTELESLHDEEITLKVNDYRSLKDKVNSLKVSKKVSQLNILLPKLNKYETELVELYSKRFDTSLDFEKDWKNIKNKLNKTDVAIEFSNYTYKGEINYIAYIIKENSEYPEVVELFKEEELKAILNTKTPNQLYKTRGSKAKNITVSEDVYDVVWKPIESHLKNTKTIYYSPVGLLNQVPFAALNKTNQLLSNTYNLVQLSSTNLLTESFGEPKQDNTLFIGGVSYDFAPKNKTKEDKNSKLSFLKSAKGNRNLGEKWNYLPGTLKEVKSVQKLFKKKQKKYISLEELEATEEVFKKLSGNSPSILHIATHGFFFESTKKMTVKEYANLDFTTQPVYKVSEDPLMRSGLILAGANYAWEHGSNPYQDEDGVLTAADISNLDLSNTDMVVLSACNTGLGDIDGSEGVYGLQRAFKMAGVDIIVMSLWEVPDEETAEFMELFYGNWLTGMKVRNAFNKTQRTMSEKYKDAPEKWAAFVLFE